MLTSIQIKNFALIRNLEVEVGSGLTVVTGETGSGKSLLLGAIASCLGSRFDSRATSDGKTVIELGFSDIGPEVRQWLREAELDDTDMLIVRREVGQQGRGRAFINDTPVTVAQLKELGRHLVDIHGQQENMALQTPGFQRDQLDLYAGISDQVDEYAIRFGVWKSLCKELGQLKETAEANRKEEDFLRFQLEEFEKLALQPGEIHALEEELRLLEHAGEIQQANGNVRQLLDGEDTGILSNLKRVQHELQKISGYAEKTRESLERVHSVQIELDDILSDIERSEGEVDLDPRRLEFVQARLDEVQKLQHKHGAADEVSLQKTQQELQQKLVGIEHQDERSQFLESETQNLRQELTSKAEKIRASRKKAAAKLAAEIQSAVQVLGMPKARVEISVEPMEDLSATGADKVVILFNANLGQALQPLGTIASGGEVARVMLALKAVVRGDENRTLIFDEIDTGVSGEVALKMGTLMQEIARNGQVLTVTHLPGVAARGKDHWKVFKSEVGGKTVVQLKELQKEGRVAELASMFSGDAKTEASMESARNLLERSAG